MKTGEIFGIDMSKGNDYMTIPRKVPVRIIETGEVFGSIKECADAIGGTPSVVSNVVNKRYGYVSVQGYHIVRADEDYIPRQHKVMINETGEVFNSLRACAHAIDGVPSGIHETIYGRRKSYKGYTFSYL